MSPPQAQAVMIDTYLRSPTSLLAIAVAGVVLAVSWLVLRSSTSSNGTSSLTGRAGKGTPHVLLVGPSDGGKTSVFAQLVYSLSPPTHPSLTPSTALYTPPSSSSNYSTIKLTDLPGHPRLKQKQQAYLTGSGGAGGDVKGVVIVVDVGGLMRGGSGVGSGGIAEQLLPIMTSLAARSLSIASSSDLPKLLILAHKADTLRSTTITVPPPTTDVDEKTLTASMERTRTVLTREMSKLKSARSTPRGKIEGMSAVPRGSSSSSPGGLLGLVRSLFGLGTNVSDVVGSTNTSEEDEQKEEDAEQMIWGESDREGPFKWEDVDGLEVSWGASWVVPSSSSVAVESRGEKSETEKKDGLGMLRDWLDEL